MVTLSNALENFVQSTLFSVFHYRYDTNDEKVFVKRLSVTKSTVVGEFPKFTEDFANLCLSEDNHLSCILKQIFNGTFKSKIGVDQARSYGGARGCEGKRSPPPPQQILSSHLQKNFQCRLKYM